MQIQPYLTFEGRTEEAVEFYKKALGAEVEMMLRFKDSPEPPPPGMVPPGSENKIMHVTLKIGGAVLLASDGGCRGGAQFSGISLALTVDSTEEAKRCLDALSDGGTVQMPITTTFFSPGFGMVTDRFGVSWSILTAQPT